MKEIIHHKYKEQKNNADKLEISINKVNITISVSIDGAGNTWKFPKEILSELQDKTKVRK